METIKISTAQNIDIDYEIAGLGERIVARLIDLAGFSILFIIVLILMGVASMDKSGTAAIVLVVIFSVLFFFYDLACELAMNGQSFGKKAMKIKVISIDGTQPSFGQYLSRWLFRMLDFCFFLGWGLVALIMVAVSEKHQRLGDLIAKTTLIKTVPRTQYNNVAFNLVVPEEYVPTFTEVIHLNDRDVELIHEVVRRYYKTGNPDLIYAMAAKTKEHIAATIPTGMHELKFLETVVYDYNYLTANTGV